MQSVKEIFAEALQGIALPTEEDFISRDRRTCDCELTYVHRKHHAALGTGIEIRLCCMAKKLEEICGLPSGTFFFAMDFEPTWEWDCEAEMLSTKVNPDGSVEEVRTKLGKPPEWLQKRFDAKGIKVKNR